MQEPWLLDYQQIISINEKIWSFLIGVNLCRKDSFPPQKLGFVLQTSPDSWTALRYAGGKEWLPSISWPQSGKA